MSLRGLRERNEERPYSKKQPHAKRLDAVLAAGVAQTGALVPKPTFEPLGKDAAAVVERAMRVHAQQTMRTVGREFVADLVSFYTEGYAHFDSRLTLAQSVHIPMFGEVTATARISKASGDVYHISVSAMVANGPYGMACKEVDTKVDLRQLRSRLHRGYGLLQNINTDNELRELVEAYVGIDLVHLDLATLPQQQGPATLYKYVTEMLIRDNGPPVLLAFKCIIELEKTYLEAMLMMAYQPDQVLGIMHNYEVHNLFDFMLEGE